MIVADAVLEPVREPGVPSEDPGPDLQPLPGEPRLPRDHFRGENKFALLWGEAQLCLPYVCL